MAKIEIENEAPYAIIITSYEKESPTSRQKTPILSHIFWGKNLKEAFNYAKSHLMTDYFFSSTFVGEMKWIKGELYLEFKSSVVKLRAFPEQEFIDLEREAAVVNRAQIEAGIDDLIREINERVQDSQ